MPKANAVRSGLSRNARAQLAGASLLLTLSLVTLPANGQTVADSTEAAKELIASNRPESARPMLERLVAEQPSNVEALFLLGLIDVASASYPSAVRWFRRALVHEPKATRIRLELGRAFYLNTDYENAARQFQFARAGKIPSEVIANIERYLAAIRREKSWSYNVSVAIAPDTNINNATSARETELLGIPFELSDDAQKRSGVGLAVEAGAEFAPRIGRAVRWRLGASVQRREYAGGGFDDMTVAVQSGPRLVTGKWDISLLGTGLRRWYGGKRYIDAAGARLEATHYLDGRTAISSGMGMQKLRYVRDRAQSGPTYNVHAAMFRALTSSTSAHVRLGAIRHKARAQSFSRWSWLAGVGYYTDLPGGFSISLEPSHLISRYDGADPLFNVRRVDHLTEVQATVLNRRVVLSRFTPRVAYTWSRRKSTIGLFDFNQHRVEVGLTSRF